MKAEQVVEKILSEGRQEAQRILSEAQAKVRQRRSALEEELKAFEQETEQLARQAAEDKRSRMLAAARMDLRKKILAAKADLLREVFETACRRINTMADGPYLELMGRLLMQAVVTGDEEVLVGKNETRINPEFLKQINKRLGPGYKGNLRPAAEKADIDGGFILRRGKVQVNCSTEVLLEQIRQQTEMELAAKLFAD
ncbi:MAG TPA: V-type ATP synthase subunit E family protein [Anaerohalosphaeraceae bacterium]|nr:V-type ATP synthase subunit E family protein [Anaerohalosphaeraceae bacterium]